MNDYANFTSLFDRNLHCDLTKELPVLPKAVAATPQYLFPQPDDMRFRRYHPNYLNTTFVVRMIENAQVNGKRGAREIFYCFAEMS